MRTPATPERRLDVQPSGWTRETYHEGTPFGLPFYLWRHDSCGETEALPLHWSERSRRAALMRHQIRECKGLSGP